MHKNQQCHGLRGDHDKADVDYEKIGIHADLYIGFIADNMGLDVDHCRFLVRIEQVSEFDKEMESDGGTGQRRGDFIATLSAAENDEVLHRSIKVTFLPNNDERYQRRVEEHCGWQLKLKEAASTSFFFLIADGSDMIFSTSQAKFVAKGSK